MTMMIAHRGVSAYAPENTLPAFTLAWALDLPAIELDIQVNRDGKVLVNHDETTKRICKTQVTIADTDWAELEKLDVGSHKGAQFANTHLSLLKDVLQAMPTGKTVQIEIKPEIRDMAPVIDAMGQLRRDINIMIISFDRDKLNQVAPLFPDYPYYWIMETKEMGALEDIIAYATSHHYAGIDVEDSSVTGQAFVDKVHQAGLKLCVWTVDDKQKAEALRGWGVDMIASNRPHEI